MRAQTLEVLNLVIVAVVVAIGIGIWALFGKQLPPMVPLFYTLPWGGGQLASSGWLGLLPGMAIVTGVGCGLMARVVSREKVLAMMILYTSLVVQLLLTLAMIRIVLITT